MLPYGNATRTFTTHDRSLNFTRLQYTKITKECVMRAGKLALQNYKPSKTGCSPLYHFTKCMILLIEGALLVKNNESGYQTRDKRNARRTPETAKEAENGVR